MSTKIRINKRYQPDSQIKIQHLDHQINRDITLTVDTINDEDLDGLEISVNNQLIAAVEVDTENKVRLIEYGDINQDEPIRIIKIKNLTTK